MRIALLTHQWPGVRLGGIGAYTLHAARGLARAGHDVHVFTLTLPPDARAAAADLPTNVHRHEVEGLAPRVMNGSVPSALGAAVQTGGEALHRLALACLLCEEVERVHGETPFDVVEGPEYESLALPLIVGARGERKVPAIVTQIHSGSAIGRDVGNLQPAREQSLRELLELATLEGGDGLCAPSRQVITDTCRAYGRDDIAAHAEVLLLPFEVADEAFSPPPAEGAVLYIGRLEWLKGSHLLAQAANDFLSQNPRARLRLAGPDTMTAPAGGGSMGAWMRATLLPAVRDRVIFLGEQTRTQIAGELRACSFFVAPSLRESYSYVCCEALAAGRPAVVSDQTGAAEVVGDAGIIVPRGDVQALAGAMTRLWRNGIERDHLGRRAWNRARHILSGAALITQRVAFYRCVAAAAPDAARGRLSKVEGIDWLGQVIAAIHRRDAGGVQTLINDWGVLKTPGTRLVEALAGHAVNPARFYLYGAGRHTARLLTEKSLWEAKGHELVGLIDDHPRFQQTPEHLGLPVISGAAAAKKLGGADAVVLSTDAFEDQFWQQTDSLRARGVAVYRLYGSANHEATP